MNMNIDAPYKASADALTVTDNRSGRSYHIPIRHNAIHALALRAITIPETGSNPVDQVGNGLRVLDPGYRNTAVKESRITYM